MPNALNTTRCLLCETKLVKNGRTAAGTQRWKCPTCGASSSRQRNDITRKANLTRFLDWLQGNQPQSSIDGTNTGRSFRRLTAWCWQLRPQIPVTGEVYDVLQIDGFNLHTGWCVLTARHQDNVVAYQWCARESQAAWSALLLRVPAPTVVVCDGGKSMHAALREHWPETKVQRCLVHLQRNVRSYTTTKSKTNAGRALWGLAKELTKVRTPADAQAWTELFLAWEHEYLDLTKERTYRKDATQIPARVKPTQQWWYTHQRLRSGYSVLRNFIKAETLFTFLDPDLEPLNVPSTTNAIEGGTNSQMRLLLLQHRGMPEEHQRRAIEWWLYLHSPYPDPLKVLAAHDHTAHAQRQAVKESAQEPAEGPELYGTALDASEGLWLRAGWAGRS